MHGNTKMRWSGLAASLLFVSAAAAPAPGQRRDSGSADVASADLHRRRCRMFLVHRAHDAHRILRAGLVD
jgi:hypothetical protein